MTDRWTADRVLEASADWVWVPAGARERAPGDYHAVDYPDHIAMIAQVVWTRSSRKVAELVPEVCAQMRAWGRREFGWWVSEGTRPTDLEDHLATVGWVAERVEVVALELAHGTLANLGDLGRVTVLPIDDEVTVRAADRINQAVSGRPPSTPERLAGRLREVSGPDKDSASFQVVSFVDGAPAASGGCTLAGEVARLWGGQTVPELRGRGAYRALLLERMRIAAERGATLALVKGRVETSAPILKRAGFTSYGEERRYQLEA